MKAQVLEQCVDIIEQPAPLILSDLPVPVPGESEILVHVSACGVCHTELDEIEGRASPRLPVIPGHQVVGRVESTGSKVTRFRRGDRVGIAWIYSACGHCMLCSNGLENLCSEFKATGMDSDGGYAEYMKVQDEYAYPVPDVFTDYEAAPLLCAGAIGYRSLHLTNLQNGENLGLTGFGGSGHLVLMMARYSCPDSNIFVFARNPEERSFAMELGAAWAGDISQPAPERLQAIIDTTPVWGPVVMALENLAPAGRLVINAIRKESGDQDSLLTVDYSRHFWMEKEIKSVANVTRRDVRDFLNIAAEIPIKPHVEVYPLDEANRALYDLKTKRIRGSKVLQIA